MKIVKTVKIGRHPNCDYQLNASNDKTSRNHATLYIYKDGTMELEDTSINGTFVNGTKVLNRKVWVKRDDLIKFADQERLDWSRIDKVSSGPNLKLIFSAAAIGVVAAVAFYFLPLPGCTDCDVDCIRKKYDKSVGLIFQSYYLKLDIVDSKYFIGYDKKKYEKEQVLKPTIADSPDKLIPFTLTGTGFLLKNPSTVDNGNLVTNRHVADPAWAINNKDYNSILDKEFIEGVKAAAYLIEQILSIPNNPDRKFQTHTSTMKFIPSGSILNFNRNMTYLERLNKMGSSNSQVLRWSKDEEVDLAILTTENNPSYQYIDLKNDIKENLQDIKVGSEIVVLGYSGGINSAFNTLKSDLTYQTSKGDISKNVTNYEIAYDIRTEAGSSGAPVIDQCGEIIGVNTARLGTNGIAVPIKHLFDVLNFKNVVLNNQRKNKTNDF